MKKTILHFLAVLIVLTSCQKNSENNNSDSKDIISLDVKMITNNPENLTQNQKILYNEARNRMDSIVKFVNNKYEIETENYESIGISKDLFEYFISLMNGTNEFLASSKIKGSKLIIQYNRIAKVASTFSVVPPKCGNRLDCILPECAKNEILDFVPDKCCPVCVQVGGGTGGIDKLITHWWGFELYLSHMSLVDIAAGTAFAAVITGLTPDPTMATKIVTIILAGCSALSTIAANHYPNGIIINSAWPVFPLNACVPTTISSQ